MADDSKVVNVVEKVENNKPSKCRKSRKRGDRIRIQMEFYFSDSNLAKDRFLGKLVNENEGGYVDLEVFKTFNKIRAITVDLKDIEEAVSKSKLLELNSDRTKIRRTQPLAEKINFDDSTIYVERLPPYADYRWVKNVFQQFGSIAYVRVPRFKTSGKNKGYAFVEFDALDSSQRACENYKSSSEDENEEENNHSKEKKPQGLKKKAIEFSGSKNKEASLRKISKKRQKSGGDATLEKYSKATSEEHKGEPQTGTKEDLVRVLEVSSSKHGKSLHKGNRKRKRQTSESEVTLKKVKHPKSSNTNRGVKVTAVAKTAATNTIPKDMEKVSPETQIKNESEPVSEIPSNGEHLLKTEVIKCEDENAGILEKSGTDCSDNVDASANKNVSVDTDEKIDLASDVCPRQEADIKLENVENEVTDKKMEISDSAKPSKKKNRHKKKSRMDNDRHNLRVMSKAEWKMYRNKYLSLQRATMSHIKKVLMLHSQQLPDTGGMLNEVETATEQPVIVEEQKPAGSNIKFQPGVIIKIVLPEAVVSHIEQKKQIRSITDVAYVDSSEGSTQVYVRCHSPESASVIVTDKKFNHLGTVDLLEGEEESNYWQKLEKDRVTKFNSNTRQKKRGRDKILAKAAKLMEQKNKHVRFEN